MLTVGHVWVKQVSGAIVVMRLSIWAPVGFAESWMRREQGESGDTKEDIK